MYPQGYQRSLSDKELISLFLSSKEKYHILSYFVHLRRILNRLSHSTQCAQWPLEFDCKIETRYMNILAPCVEERQDAVMLLVKQQGQNSFSSICRIKFKFCLRCLTSNATVLSRRSSTQGAEMFVYLVSILQSNCKTVTACVAYCVVVGFNIRCKSTK